MDKLLIECIEWDVVNWSKALTFWERATPLSEREHHCLELGARKGGLSLWLATKGNSVVCSDLTNPEANASDFHKQHSFSGTISYQAIDATSIPYENHFDIVIFKSILGGISKNENSHLRHTVMSQIYQALKPGGTVLFAENLLASSAHQFLRAHLTRWGRYWNYLSLGEVDTLFRDFSAVQYGTAGFLGAFGRTEFQRRMFGRVDSLIFDNFLPDKMKYIVFGTATK